MQRAQEDAINFGAQRNDLLVNVLEPFGLKSTISKVLYGKLSAAEEDNKKVSMLLSLCIYHSKKSVDRPRKVLFFIIMYSCSSLDIIIAVILLSFLVVYYSRLHRFIYNRICTVY